MKRAQEVVQDLLKKRAPTAVLENKIKDALTNFTSKELGRRPMILPLVMEV
jgi:ribonuclease J